MTLCESYITVKINKPGIHKFLFQKDDVEGVQMGNGKYIDILRFHDKPYTKRRLT